MESRTSLLFGHHSFLLGSLTKCQHKLIKGPLVDIDNKFNKVFSLFNPLHSEFSSSNRVIDIFPSCFSFHLFKKNKDNNFKEHIQQLDNLVLESLSIPLNVLIITDASIKNNITMFISHTHIYNKPIMKTLYHTVNVMEYFGH